MRVTAETREKTRRRILEVAGKLFAERGWEETTTREIAAKAGIAAGTLFNYFPAKEALALSIVERRLEEGVGDFDSRRFGSESLEEELFALIMSGLRRLSGFRKTVGEIAETALSPFSSGLAGADRIRDGQLEAAFAVLARHGLSGEPSHLVMHMYWTLYVGVLMYWANDSSTNQEDTLAFIDYATRMFASSLESRSIAREVDHGT